MVYCNAGLGGRVDCSCGFNLGSTDGKYHNANVCQLLETTAIPTFPSQPRCSTYAWYCEKKDLCKGLPGKSQNKTTKYLWQSHVAANTIDRRSATRRHTWTHTCLWKRARLFVFRLWFYDFFLKKGLSHESAKFDERLGTHGRSLWMKKKGVFIKLT